MKNTLYLLIVLLAFSCKTTEVVKKVSLQKRIPHRTSKAEYDQYIKDTKLLFLDKISNKIRIYGQILCPGAPRAEWGFDRPFDPRDKEIFDLKHRPQICGSFEYNIRKVIAGDTILLNRILKTDAKGRYDIRLDYGHYLLQAKLDTAALNKFESNIQSPTVQKYFHSLVKATWTVISEKDTAISLNLGAFREDRFESLLKGAEQINAPTPMHLNKNF